MADNATRFASVSVPMWALIIMLTTGTIGGTWAVCSEAHNYRSKTIEARQDAQDGAILSLRDADTESKLERAANRIGIEQATKLLEEIRGDIKTIMANQ